jgi:hypothetical protein
VLPLKISLYDRQPYNIKVHTPFCKKKIFSRPRKTEQEIIILLKNLEKDFRIWRGTARLPAGAPFFTGYIVLGRAAAKRRIK